MAPPQLPAVLSKCWKLMTLKGTFGILVGSASAITLLYLNQPSYDPFGLSLFLQAATLIAFLVLYLGLYALLDGVCAFTMGFRLQGQMCRWWALLGKGFISVALGIAVWIWPRFFMPSLSVWIAVWAFLVEILELTQGIDPNGYGARNRQCLWAGLFAWAFGALLLIGGFSGKSLIGLLSVYALISAIPTLWLAVHLRGLAKSLPAENAA